MIIKESSYPTSRKSRLYFLVIILLLIGCSETPLKNTPVPQSPQIHKLPTAPTKTPQPEQSLDSPTWAGMIFYTDGKTVHVYPDDFFSEYDELESILAFVFQQEIERYEYVFTLIRPSPMCDRIVLQEVKGYDRQHRAVGATWLVDKLRHELIKVVDEPVLVKWSPDNTNFLYVLEDGMYLQHVDELGQSVRVVQSTTNAPLGFKWSPDGEWIVYVIPTHGKYQLWLMSARDYSKRLLDTVSLLAAGYAPDVDVVQWSPTSDIIQVTGKNGLLFYNLEGRRLTSDAFQLDDWLFCKAEKCIRQRGSMEPEDYVRISPMWAVCPKRKNDRSPLGISPNCNLRIAVSNEKLYLNNLLDGQMQELVYLRDSFVTHVFWLDDTHVVFSEPASDDSGKIYVFNLQTSELSELPVGGVLLGVCSF